MDISEKEIQASLHRTEKRREQAREIRRRQMRKVWLGVLAFAIVVSALFLGITSGGEKQTPPPVLSVIWPHGENEPALPAQHVTDGTTLLIKSGQPVKVALPEAGKWDAVWATADVKNIGDSFDWTPSGADAKLTVRLRAHLSGWKKLMAWRWPSREITLHGVAGTTPTQAPAGGFLHEIQAPEAGMWLHFRTVAKRAKVRYDVRAIKAYGETAAQMQPVGADAATADSEIWQLIPAFDSDRPHAGDIGTYAMLKTSDPSTDAKRAFQVLDKIAPRATIKVIVNQSDGEARFRLSFDDKAQRYVWVQQAGTSSAEPQDWLEE